MKSKSFVVIVLLFLFCSISFSRDLIIAGIPEEPNRWINENGELTGLDVDIIDHIMKKMGVKYKIILEQASTRLRHNWEVDKSPYDMVFTYSKKAAREKKLYYANESHISFSWNLFYTAKNEGKYKFENFEDLRGLKIGMTKGFSYTKEFWDAANKGIFKKDVVVKNELQLMKLLKNRTDLVCLNTTATLYELKTKGLSDKVSYLKKPIKSKPYYNTFVKSSDYPNLDKVRKQYDIILKEMKEDGTLNKILQKYGLNIE